MNYNRLRKLAGILIENDEYKLGDDALLSLTDFSEQLADTLVRIIRAEGEEADPEEIIGYEWEMVKEEVNKLVREKLRETNF